MKFEKKKIGGVIIDGADQMGKSTVAERLLGLMSEVTKVKTIHYGRNKTTMSEIDYYTQPLSDDYPYIIDRNYVSEMVYGPIYRGGSMINDNDMREIERRFTFANYFVVLINRTGYEWEDRPEEYDKDGNDRVIEAYKDIYAKIGMDKMLISTSNPVDMVGDIVDYWIEKNGLI